MSQDWNVATRRIQFSGSVPDSVREVDVVFLAAGTPPRRGDGYADRAYVFDVGEGASAATRRRNGRRHASIGAWAVEQRPGRQTAPRAQPRSGCGPTPNAPYQSRTKLQLIGARALPDAFKKKATVTK